MSQEQKSLGFENLAKTIGARWKQMLSDEERAPYKEMAAVSFSSWCSCDMILWLVVSFSSNSRCIFSSIPNDTRMKWQPTRNTVATQLQVHLCKRKRRESRLLLQLLLLDELCCLMVSILSETIRTAIIIQFWRETEPNYRLSKSYNLRDCKEEV